MADYWRMSAIGGVLSGTLGIHGHFANGLAALYLATGQDAACVAESATGVTRFEVTEDGGLYATVTLPGIMVGTVGGGTGLPTQKACLELMGLHGTGSARALAEVCAGLLLAGELSIIAALAAGHFARAHRKLARGRRLPTPPHEPLVDLSEGALSPCSRTGHSSPPSVPVPWPFPGCCAAHRRPAGSPISPPSAFAC